MMRANGRRFLPLVALDGRFVVCRSLALDERDGILRAARQAIAEPVAEIVAHEFGLPADNLDSPFMARVGANAAAVAFLFVDLYDRANHAVPFVVLIGCMIRKRRYHVCCNYNIHSRVEKP